jgi:3'-5' exoribonuclease
MQTIRDKVNAFSNDSLKKLVNAVLDEYGSRMLDCPAAFRLHHAIRGGLLMHTLSIVKLCECVASIYPSVDRELLISGAILHDVCKTDEFVISQSGLVDGYTPEGTLVGHLVMGAVSLADRCRELGIGEEKTVMMEHMAISHHYEPEYGSPKKPLFPEAEMLHYLDMTDAKLFDMEDALKNVDPGEFSDKVFTLDNRKIYKRTF